MIVKNEEANLPACLESIREVVHEIIVVDTGSTDRTKEVASRFGARVFDFPWVDSFSAARNESLSHATGNWAFWLDADDRLDAANRDKLRALFARLNGEITGYSMKCLCLPDKHRGTSTAVDHLRLFPNHPKIRWEYRVHEQILPSIRRMGGNALPVSIFIQHTGYQDASVRARKHERDLRLLEMDFRDNPKDPFTLFNLGWLKLETGYPAEAIPFLRESLKGSQPADSIVRKLHTLLVQCHRQLGQAGEALETCESGRHFYPDDVELLFHEGLVRREKGDRAGAEKCFLRILQSREGPHFASLDVGLATFKARHNLAVLYSEQGRVPEAEAQWQTALKEDPTYFPARLGLLELYLGQRRIAEAQRITQRVETEYPEAPWGPILRARSLLAGQDFAAARSILEEAGAQFPYELLIWIILGNALLAEGKDLSRAEEVLRKILKLDPANTPAKQNLAALVEKQRSQPDNAEARRKLATFVDHQGRTNGEPNGHVSSLADLYQLVCRTPSDINEHCPTLNALARQCRHITELGTRTGASTAALLFAQPDKLVCYDLRKYPEVDRLQALAGPAQFVFHEADVLRVEIEETDLLFIDTCHVYGQLKEELRLHSAKVRKYIVLHDTTTFGERGETEGHRGLWPAVEEFLGQGVFKLKHRYEHNNGLTILEREPPNGPGNGNSP